MAHPYRSRSYILPARNLQTRSNSYRSMSSHDHWSSTPTSRSLRSFYAHEDFYDDYVRNRSQKKSIFTRAKEKAKKWRQTLLRTKSKHEEDHINGTPPWGVSLNDEDEEDESELIHGTSKAGLDAFEDSDSEKNSTIHYPSPCNPACNSAPSPALENAEREWEMKQSNDGHTQPPSPEVLGPASIKLAPVAVSTTEVAPAADATTTKASPSATADSNMKPAAAASSPVGGSGSKTLGETVSETLAPAYATVAGTLAPAYAAVAGATMAISSKIQVSAGKQLVWEKGASMREYLMQKLADPKAEDKELCKVITKAAVSPRTSGANEVFEEEKMEKEGGAAASSSPLASPSSSVQASALAKEEEAAEPSTKREKANSPIPAPPIRIQEA